MLYAQACPEEPTIPVYQKFQRSKLPIAYQDQLQDQLSQATSVVSRRTQIKQFRPRIIKSNRASFQNSFKQLEHQRQIASMRKRIQNCKSIQQRKKDKNDPIVYPPYFVRKNQLSPDVRLDSYTQKVMTSSGWKEKQKKLDKIYENQKTPLVRQLKNNKQIMKFQYSMKVKKDSNSKIYYDQENPQQQTQMPSPMFYKKEVHCLKPVQSSPIEIKRKEYSNLPQNDIRSMLDFIYNRLIYKEEGLLALKSRMIHAYGKQTVKNTWKLSMRLLERDI